MYLLKIIVSASVFRSNYATPVIRTPATRTPSVFVKADRSNSISPNKGAKVSNLFKRTSFAASDQSSEGGSSNRNSLEQPIELTEQACTLYVWFAAVCDISFPQILYK